MRGEGGGAEGAGDEGGGWEKGLELIKAKKEIPTEVKELLDNAEDMQETVSV